MSSALGGAKSGESGKSSLALQSYAIVGSYRHLQNKEINTSSHIFLRVVSLFTGFQHHRALS